MILMWFMPCRSHLLSVTITVPDLGSGRVNLHSGYPEHPMKRDPLRPRLIISSEPHFSQVPTILSVRRPSLRDWPMQSWFSASSSKTDVSITLDSSTTSSSFIFRSEMRVMSFSSVWVISGLVMVGAYFCSESTTA
ncbi:MAG: hypothetical protein A4E48_01333 [Methanosaeta sp. PtaU1.Bin060]|nr:MAG: hypothetical protein A4E48_01333 [Methanosaeta sp. PtaU1.Bin060]